LSNFHQHLDSKVIFPEDIIEITEKFKSYTFKFIVIHIALFLTKNVNSSSKFCHAYYNASYTFFFRNFIKTFYSNFTSEKIIRVIEKAMGDFNKNTLNLEFQDPLTASKNVIYKSEDFKNRLDFISFIKQISDNEDDFEEYLENTEPIDKFGEKDEANMQDLKKENYKYKSRMLISLIKIMTGFKDLELLKANFDLLSKECPSNKHIIISIAGLSNERTKQTEKWEKFIETNQSVTVYAYRWKTKGMMPSLSSFVPKLTSLLDIGMFFSKAYLAYRAIKVPLDYRQRFYDCWEMSKLYGKILAHSLMIQFPFVNQSVSLFGFELG
jgi:hypothetical protein